MNCREVQSKIAEMAGDSPAPEIVAHARECAACRQIVSETLDQQKWLRERFAEVSADLLAHAPPFSRLDFHERREVRVRRAPLLPLAYATLLAVALIGGWIWTNSPSSPPKSSVAEQRASSYLNAPLSEFKSVGPVPGSPWLADKGPLPSLPQAPAVPEPSPEPAVSGPSPEVAVSEPSPRPNSPLSTGVFKMEPTASAPDASGYLAAIIPKDASDQAPALEALSLSGLPAESDFYVRTRDVGGNAVWLGSGRTDIRGSALIVMLRGSPITARGPVTFPVADTQPPVTLNFDGATGDDLVVVDPAGNVLLTVAPAAAAPDANP